MPTEAPSSEMSPNAGVPSHAMSSGTRITPETSEMNSRA